MDNELIKEREEFWKLQYKKIDEKVLAIPPIKKHEYQEIKDDVRLVYELLEEKHPKEFSKRISKGENHYVMILLKEQIFVRLIKQSNANIYIIKEFSDNTYNLNNLSKSLWFNELVSKCRKYNRLFSYEFTEQDFDDICSEAYIVLQTISPPPPLQQELAYFLSTTVAKSVLKAKQFRKNKNTMSLELLTEEEKKDKLRSELIASYEIEAKEERKKNKMIRKVFQVAVNLIPEKKRKYVMMLLDNRPKEEIANALSIQVSSINDYFYDTKRAIVKQVEKQGTSVESLKKKYRNED